MGLRRELGPCFKMYPGFLFIRYSKRTDMETTVFKRRDYYSQIPGGGGMPHHTGPHGSARLVRRQKERAQAWAPAFIEVFSGKARHGR